MKLLRWFREWRARRQARRLIRTMNVNVQKIECELAQLFYGKGDK